MKEDVSKSLSAYTELGTEMKDVGKSMSKYVTAPIVAAGTASVYCSCSSKKPCLRLRQSVA